MRKFTKAERSSFAYWFWHWYAFQKTAMELHAWKLKYFFHDMEKPWLKLFWKDYARVQKWHRTHNRHHLESSRPIDYEGLVIDWECSRLTKVSSPLRAMEEARVKLADGEIDETTFNKIANAAKKLHVFDV